MPTLFHRDVAIEAGLYPCGNIAGSSFDEVVRCGDEAFFDALGALGVDHYTALDSIVYHLKEGEREDVADGETGSSLAQPVDTGGVRTKALAYPQEPAIERVRDSMPPTKRHEALVSAVSSDKELRERRRQLAALAEADVIAIALHDQAECLRAQVERVLGPRLAIPAMRLIHSVSWMTRPLRRWLALRRSRHDTRAW